MPVTRDDLVEALAGVARGDKAAFEMVYAATSLKLYGIVVRILGQRALADEVLQEVYVRVWQRAGEFDPATSSPWPAPCSPCPRHCRGRRCSSSARG